jgi:hypothetical protein
MRSMIAFACSSTASKGIFFCVETL